MREELRERRISDTTFCFLDVETTGLRPHFGDRICEIALLKWRENETLDAFSTLVNPERPIPPGACAVHGITDEMVREAPKFGEIAEEVIGFIGDSVIVAHNAPFDMSFLAFQLAELKLPQLQNPVLCTLRLARSRFSFRSYSLASIAYELGVEMRGWHRAMVDVETTKEIFRLFLRRFREEGIIRLGELLELQGDIPLPRPDALILPPAVEEAVRSGRPLQIRYLSFLGRETVRIIEPLEVVCYRGYIYLIAFCRMCGGRRTFRFDRILEMRPI